MTTEEQRDELVGMVAIAIAEKLWGVTNLNTVSEENARKFRRSAREAIRITGEAVAVSLRNEARKTTTPTWPVSPTIVYNLTQGTKE